MNIFNNKNKDSILNTINSIVNKNILEEDGSGQLAPPSSNDEDKGFNIDDKDSESDLLTKMQKAEQDQGFGVWSALFPTTSGAYTEQLRNNKLAFDTNKEQNAGKSPGQQASEAQERSIAANLIGYFPIKNEDGTLKGKPELTPPHQFDTDTRFPVAFPKSPTIPEINPITNIKNNLFKKLHPNAQQLSLNSTRRAQENIANIQTTNRFVVAEAVISEPLKSSILTAQPSSVNVIKQENTSSNPVVPSKSKKVTSNQTREVTSTSKNLIYNPKENEAQHQDLLGNTGRPVDTDRNPATIINTNSTRAGSSENTAGTIVNGNNQVGSPNISGTKPATIKPAATTPKVTTPNEAQHQDMFGGLNGTGRPVDTDRNPATIKPAATTPKVTTPNEAQHQDMFGGLNGTGRPVDTDRNPATIKPAEWRGRNGMTVDELNADTNRIKLDMKNRGEPTTVTSQPKRMSASDIVGGAAAAEVRNNLNKITPSTIDQDNSRLAADRQAGVPNAGRYQGTPGVGSIERANRGKVGLDVIVPPWQPPVPTPAAPPQLAVSTPVPTPAANPVKHTVTASERMAAQEAKKGTRHQRMVAATAAAKERNDDDAAARAESDRAKDIRRTTNTPGSADPNFRMDRSLLGPPAPASTTTTDSQSAPATTPVPANSGVTATSENYNELSTIIKILLEGTPTVTDSNGKRMASMFNPNTNSGGKNLKANVPSGLHNASLRLNMPAIEIGRLELGRMGDLVGPDLDKARFKFFREKLSTPLEAFKSLPALFPALNQIPGVNSLRGLNKNALTGLGQFSSIEDVADAEMDRAANFQNQLQNDFRTPTYTTQTRSSRAAEQEEARKRNELNRNTTPAVTSTGTGTP